MCFRALQRHIDLLICLTLLLTGPLFFYNLGGFSLVDFDEAWWAEVARNINISGNPFVLTFNGKPNFYHPPFGYLLIAISQSILGANEFASRLPSAILGLGSLFLTYFLGKTLFNRFVGFVGAATIVSSVWFILRARSGNLDTIFVFMFLLTIYLFVRSKTNRWFLYHSAISFGFLFLTKALVGFFCLFPIIVYYLLNQKSSAWKPKDILISLVLFVVVIEVWFLSNFMLYKMDFVNFVIHNASKPEGRILPNVFEILSSNTMLYLHYGILKWYYPFLISLLGGIFFIKKNLNILVIYAWIVIFAFAFLTNSFTEIWHLLPIYPAVGIFIGFFLFSAFNLGMKNFLTPHERFRKLGLIFLALTITFAAGWQVYQFRDGVNLFTKGQSDLAVVSSRAAEETENLYLDSEYFLPSVVFYSHKNVTHITDLEGQLKSAKGFANFGPKPSLLITQHHRLNLADLDPNSYKQLNSFGEYILLKFE